MASNEPVHPSRPGTFCRVDRVKRGRIMRAIDSIQRTSARRPIMSVYFYDPDENLVEVSNQLPTTDSAQNS